MLDKTPTTKAATESRAPDSSSGSIEPAGYLRSSEQLMLRRKPIDALGYHA
jgi:hypothetical protein